MLPKTAPAQGVAFLQAASWAAQSVTTLPATTLCLIWAMALEGARPLGHLQVGRGGAPWYELGVRHRLHYSVHPRCQLKPDQHVDITQYCLM